MIPSLTSHKTNSTRLKMSYQEFLDWTTEDTHAEWVKGEVFVHMPAKDIHQATLGFLYTLLRFFIDLFNLGETRVAPFEMQVIPGQVYREPDLFFLAKANLDRLTNDKLIGPPDLIVEIVSKSSMKQDREDKLKEYAAAGVLEYWIVDPRPDKQRADFYQLGENGMYTLFATEEDERVESKVLPGFWLKPAWLWQKELTPLDCALQIDQVRTKLKEQLG